VIVLLRSSTTQHIAKKGRLRARHIVCCTLGTQSIEAMDVREFDPFTSTYTVVDVEKEHGLFIVFRHFVVGVDVNEKL